jgi:DNA replication protein DnaC
VSTAPPPLAADLNDRLKRLKMAAMRRLAPELLVTARTQRWNPEEFLRTLVEAEITAREESNARTRMRSAAFPVVKTLDEFDVAGRGYDEVVPGVGQQQAVDVLEGVLRHCLP